MHRARAAGKRSRAAAAPEAEADWEEQADLGVGEEVVEVRDSCQLGSRLFWQRLVPTPSPR